MLIHTSRPEPEWSKPNSSGRVTLCFQALPQNKQKLLNSIKFFFIEWSPENGC
jgi:hypothetical protein